MRKNIRKTNFAHTVTLNVVHSCFALTPCHTQYCHINILLIKRHDITVDETLFCAISITGKKGESRERQNNLFMCLHADESCFPLQHHWQWQLTFGMVRTVICPLAWQRGTNIQPVAPLIMSVSVGSPWTLNPHPRPENRCLRCFRRNGKQADSIIISEESRNDSVTCETV